VAVLYPQLAFARGTIVGLSLLALTATTAVRARAAPAEEVAPALGAAVPVAVVPVAAAPVAAAAVAAAPPAGVDGHADVGAAGVGAPAALPLPRPAGAARPGAARVHGGRVAQVAGAHAVVPAAAAVPAHRPGPNEPVALEVPNAPEAFYIRPRSRGPKPIIMYLHGRGGNAQEDCRKWAAVAAPFGWVVCPQGPEDRGGGARAWANSPDAAKAIIDATVTALRAKFHGQVQASGNVLIGFSEGAFVAQQVGMKDPGRWSRWLILAASDRYWSGDVAAQLAGIRGRMRRVYLLTGESDGVVEQTKATGELLKHAHIPVRVQVVAQMGHEVPADRMTTNYRRPLQWLTTGR
jgi:predicted esterase